MGVKFGLHGLTFLADMIILTPLLGLLLRKLAYCVMLDKFSLLNLSCISISFSFVLALNIAATSGLVLMLYN